MSGKQNDIKAPDGFLHGGLRKVRSDGTVLFQRGWWKVPDDLIGTEVWLHTLEPDDFHNVELALDGRHIYDARLSGRTVFAPRTERPDARPAYRRPENKAYAEKMASARQERDTHD